MASELFKEAPKGLSLEEVGDALETVAARLNEHRRNSGIRGFATVYTTGVVQEAMRLVRGVMKCLAKLGRQKIKKIHAGEAAEYWGALHSFCSLPLSVLQRVTR